jgi:uncharacterized protein
VPSRVHLILYVAEQHAAATFWRAVLDRAPALDVPGMTEFDLTPSTVPGLMPETGIRALRGTPRVELYVLLADEDDVAAHHHRALAAGATELSPPQPRSWGDVAGYSLDPDGHVVAFAARPIAAGSNTQ